MAGTNASLVYDLVSWAKTRDPDLKTAMIAELLNQSNEQVQDLVWLEGNLPTGHRITQRTGLPTTYTRQINAPVAVSRGQTAPVPSSPVAVRTTRLTRHHIRVPSGRGGPAARACSGPPA